MTDSSSLDYEFPEGLDPRLHGLAWMLGHWEGHGVVYWRDAPEQLTLQQVDFSHNGQGYLHYLLQVFANDGGKPGDPLFMESGFWVPDERNEVMVVVSNPEGVAQKWHGTITGLQSPAGGELATKIEIRTDAVLSQGTHVAGSRLYGKVQSKMMYAYDRADRVESGGRSDGAAPGEGPTPWLTGELERLPLGGRS